MPRRPRLLSPTALIRANAVSKGLLGGSRGWLAAGGVLWGSRFLKRTFGKAPESLGTEVLKPGQFVRIEAIRRPTRRQRRRASRAA
jgi:hypothetical protein